MSKRQVLMVLCLLLLGALFSNTAMAAKSGGGTVETQSWMRKDKGK